MGRIVLNVSGQRFTTTTETLGRFPYTKLGKLKYQQTNKTEYFFDADEDVFREVLRYHRTGELHAPRDMCSRTFKKQLEFWELGHVSLEECCQNNAPTDKELEKQFLWFEKRIETDRELTRKDRIWYFLTDPAGPYTMYKKTATLWYLLFGFMVVMQILFVSVTTLPQLAKIYTNRTNATYSDVMRMQLEEPCYSAQRWLEIAQSYTSVVWYICTTFFIIEIIIRFISCPSKKDFFCSLHALDVGIALLELIQYIIVLLSLGVLNYNQFGRDFCRTVSVISTIVYFTSQLRCFRLLSFCKNSR